jgi:hypothetical protein
MRLLRTAASVTVAAVLIAVPLASASAHDYHHRVGGLPGAVGAVVGGAAEIVSAPFVLLGVAPGPRVGGRYHDRGYYEEPRVAYSRPAPAYYDPPRARYPEQNQAYYAPPPRDAYGEAPRSYYAPPQREEYSAPSAYERPCDRDSDYRAARATAWNGYGY